MKAWKDKIGLHMLESDEAQHLNCLDRLAHAIYCSPIRI